MHSEKESGTELLDFDNKGVEISEISHFLT